MLENVQCLWEKEQSVGAKVCREDEGRVVVMMICNLVLDGENLTEQ